MGTGSYAYFNAQSSASTQFTSGTLILNGQRSSGDILDGPMFYTTAEDGKVLSGANINKLGKYPDGLLKPGFESIYKSFVITNLGTIDPKLNQLSAQVIEGDPVLADNLIVEVNRLNHPVKLYDGSLKALINGPQSFNSNLEVPLEGLGTTETLTFKIKFPESGVPQNQYQGKGLKVKLFVYAVPN